MAMQLFMKMKVNSAFIDGDSSTKGFEKWIELQSFSWGVTAPLAAGSGGATGKRVYKEFRWVNRHQKSSVLLWKALTQSSVVEAELDCVRDGEIFLKLNFKQAHMSAFDQAGEDVDVYEEFGLVFNTVTMLHVDGGITHEDTLIS